MPTIHKPRWALHGAFSTILAALWLTACVSQTNFAYFDAADSRLSAMPPSIPADGQTPAVLQLLVMATATQPAHGWHVALTTGSPGARLVQDSPTTDANGLLTGRLLSWQPGEVQVEAILSSEGKTLELGMSVTVQVVSPASPAVAHYTLGGRVSGLVTGNVTLSDGISGHSVTCGNGNFVIDVDLPAAAPYDVMLTQALGHTCSIGNAGGVMPAADVDNVLVSCSPNSYRLGGQVMGVAYGQVRLTNVDSGETLSASNGNYVFAQPVAYNDDYNILVIAPGSASCSVTANALGSMPAQDLLNVDVSCSAAVRLALSGYTTPRVAGEGGNVTITAYSADNAFASGYVGTVQLASSDPCAQLAGPVVFESGFGGTAQVPVILVTAGTQSLQANDMAVAGISARQDNIVVGPNEATQLRVADYPAQINAGTAANVTVAALDAWGNVATGYTGVVALASSDPHAALHGDYNFVPADAGVHALAVTLMTPGQQSLTATDSSLTTLPGTDANITVNALVPVRFTVFAYPATTIAGTAHNVSVRAVDANGATVVNYGGYVVLTSDDPEALLPAPYAFGWADLGQHNFLVTLIQSGTHDLVATDANLTSLQGSQAGIEVDPNVADHYVMSGFPQLVAAGAPHPLQVQVQDVYNNPVLAYTGTVHFGSSDTNAILPLDYTFTAGPNVTLPVTLNTAGMQNITAQDRTQPGVIGMESNIQVNPNMAARLQITVDTQTVAGAPLAVSVAVFDHAGNLVTDYNQSVTVSCSDPRGDVPPVYPFTAADDGNKVLPGSAMLVTEGTQTITVGSSDGLVATSANIVVSPGSPNHIAVLLPATAIAGTFLSPGLAVMDNWNNVVTGFTGTMNFTNTDPGAGASTPASTTFISTDAGQKQLVDALVFTTAGNQTLTATVSSPSLVGAASVDVESGNAKALLFAASAHQVAGQSFTAWVTAVDDYNNRVTGYSAQVSLGSTDLQSGLPPPYTFASGDAGEHAFTIMLATAGNQIVSASDANGVQGSAAFEVVAANANHFTVSGFPATVTAGAAGNVVVAVYDACNNLAVGYAGTVHFTSSDPNAALPPDALFSGPGTETYSATLVTAGTQTITATDANLAQLNATQGGITVNPNAADHYWLTGFLSPTVAGAQGNVLIQVQDRYNNPVTSYGGNTQVTSSDPNAGLPPIYVFSGGPNATLPVTLNTAGLQSIFAHDIAASSIAGSESDILVNPNQVAALRVTTDTTPVAGQNQVVWITAFDQAGNVANSYNQNVLLSATDPNASVPAAYQFAASDGGNKMLPGALTWFQAGAQSLTVTDGAGMTASANVTVTAGSPNHISMLLPASSIAGQALSPNVAVMDNWNNTVTTFTGNMTFTSTDVAGTAVTPGTTAFTSGNLGHMVLTHALAFTTAGNQTLSAAVTSPALAGAAQTVVEAGNPAELNLGGPTSVAAGQTFALRVTVTDNYNNICTGFTGGVTYASTDYQGWITPWTYDFVPADSGSAQNTNVMLGTVGTRTIRAVANTTAGNPNGSLTIAVGAGALARLRFGALDTVTADTNFSTPLYGADAYGNLIASYTGSVSVSSSDPNGSPPAAVPLSVTIASGGTTTLNNLRFQGWDYQTLTAVDIGNGIMGQQAFRSHPLMNLSTGQNANTLGGGIVGNNAGNPYYDPNGRLFHADSHYRTFARWNSLPTDNQAASASFTFDSTVNANYINYPTSIISDGNTGIFITDYGAHRLLHYNQTPLAYTSADSVVGQPNFTSGIGACDANRLNHPTDAVIAKNANALIVADCGNARLMVYSPIPFLSNPSATLVLGQPTLSTCATTFSASPNAFSSFCAGLYGLWTDGVHLAFADADFSRVLIFNDLPGLLAQGTNAPSADVVIGQTDLTSNSTAIPPTAVSLNKPDGIVSDGTQLFIADVLNNRVLIYETIPATNGATASCVLGQNDFVSSGSGSAQLSDVSSVYIAEKQLFVGDHANTRYQIYFGQ